MAGSSVAPSSSTVSSLSALGAVTGVRSWPVQRWMVAAIAATIAGALMGVPTGVVPSGLYTRMTAVRWWDYPVWAISAVLVGLTAATYVRTGAPREERPSDGTRRTIGATLLSTFAIGCPICNKLVVAILGVGGALTYWAPLQPLLGLMSLGLLAAGLVVRLRGVGGCAIAAPRSVTPRLPLAPVSPTLSRMTGGLIPQNGSQKKSDEIADREPTGVGSSAQPRRRRRGAAVVVVLVAAALAIAVVVSAVGAGEPAHTMPDGMTMQGEMTP